MKWNFCAIWGIIGIATLLIGVDQGCEAARLPCFPNCSFSFGFQWSEVAGALALFWYGRRGEKCDSGLCTWLYANHIIINPVWHGTAC